jgi:hypothetical protein
MVPRDLRLPAVPAHSSAGRRVKIGNCVTLSALAYSGLALCWALAVALGLWCKTVTKSDPGKPEKTKPLGGGVQHDARGNAVWQWATETARHAVASTSQLLRRLDVSSLSLEELQEDKHPPKTNAPKSQSKASPTRPTAPTRPAAPGKPAAPPSRERGFNPYDRAAIARAAAHKKQQPAVVKRARAPWWRRLFQRR